MYKDYLIGGYCGDDTIHINKDLPADHISNNCLFLEVSVNSGICCIDVDNPSSEKAILFTDNILDVNRDLISVSDKYDVNDILNHTAKYKVFFVYDGVGKSKNKRNTDIEVFYGASRGALEARTVAFYGKRFRDKYSYNVLNSEQQPRELFFEPNDFTQYKQHVRLFKQDIQHVADSMGRTTTTTPEIDGGDAVDIDEFRTALGVLNLHPVNLSVDSNGTLLTFDCLFPHEHTSKNNAYAIKREGKYICKCFGVKCEHEYATLNHKLTLFASEQEQAFDYDDLMPHIKQKVNMFKAPTGWGKTEMLAKSIVNALSKPSRKMLVLMQNKESIDRLLSRINEYSKGRLNLYITGERLGVLTAENRDSLNLEAQVIISHHFYFATCGDSFLQYPIAREILTGDRISIVDEAHTYIELATQIQLKIGALYSDSSTRYLSENHKSIKTDGNFTTTNRSNKLDFKSAIIEHEVSTYGTHMLRSSSRLYKNVEYVDIFKLINDNMTSMETFSEDYLKYTTFKNEHVYDARTSSIDDYSIIRDLVGVSQYAIVSINVGDDKPRKQYGNMSVLFQSTKILSLLLNGSYKTLFMSATFSDYHIDCLNTFGEVYETEISDTIDKVKEIVILSPDATLRGAKKKSFFEEINTLNATSLMFMGTISTAKSYMLGMDNAMLNDNGMYCVGARKSHDDYILNLKRNITFCGLEASVSKGYNYIDEITGDGFEMIYFDSLPVSPPLLKKYIRWEDNVIQDNNFDYTLQAFAQAMGRAFRKEKQRLTICFNFVDSFIGDIDSYLSDYTSARIYHRELTSTNLKLSLLSYTKELSPTVNSEINFIGGDDIEDNS